MERHARLQHSLVAAAERHRALAPVRRVGQADRVAAAAFLHEAETVERFIERDRHILAAVAGLGGLQRGLDAREHGDFRIAVFLRRLAEEKRARLRAVIAAVYAGDLEKCRFALAHGRVVPGEMRSGGVQPGRHDRHNGRVVAPMPVRPPDRRMVDVGHELMLRQTRLGALEDDLMHALNDAGGAAHVFNLDRAFHCALPVHQRSRIAEGRVGQVLDEREIGGGGEVVVLHLHADDGLPPAALQDQLRQSLHRVLFRVLDIGVVIADDIFSGHRDGAPRAGQINAASPPDRLALQAQQHALMGVERPAVIAGQPGHV